MKNVTKIVIMALCAALTLSSCKKNRYTPEEEDHLVPLGFTAVSQATMVKSEDGEVDYLSNYHSDFGVWGIARHENLQHPYILWPDTVLQEVDQVDGTNDYIPGEPAYWLSGYQYKFIAIAPFENSGVTDVDVNSDDEVLTVTLDLSGKYESAESYPQFDEQKNLYKYENAAYGFDVMTSVAQTGIIGTPKPASQPLTFWHLMSKICVMVGFRDDVADSEGNYPVLDGAVTKVVISGVDSKGRYGISPSTADPNVPSVTTLGLASGEEPAEVDITYEKLSDENVRFNMLPQNVKDMEMYLDFTVTKNGKPVPATNYMIPLSLLSKQDYLANESTNWTITITPQFIYIASGENEPTVQKWVDGAEITPEDIK